MLLLYAGAAFSASITAVATWEHTPVGQVVEDFLAAPLAQLAPLLGPGLPVPQIAVPAAPAPAASPTAALQIEPIVPPFPAVVAEPEPAAEPDDDAASVLETPAAVTEEPAAAMPAATAAATPVPERTPTVAP
ncbi:MAG TPA: hypothetical protein VFX49_14615, partial [Chloroflexota bacterium]|nr:hypothetical protein [Chloroflexota bacterium]